MDASFFQAPVEVPRLSGFDKSFMNLYTAQVGTLVPALCDELMPGSIVDLDMAASVSLPPLASDTFMRCSLKVECFFVPLRLCFGGFEHFFVGDEFEVVEDDGSFAEKSITRLPSFAFVGNELAEGETSPATFSNADLSKYFGAGTLSDYLGFKAGKMNALTFTPAVSSPFWTSGEDSSFSLMPYIAYHKLWSDWYRASLIQRDCFAPLGPDTLWSDYMNVSSLPFVCVNEVDYGSYYPLAGLFGMGSFTWPMFTLADGVDIFSLRQRNFGFDFFTCATPSPQNGQAVSVKLDPTSLATLGNGFTISQLRSMNSLQQWRERNNLTGDRYVDRLYGQYGCRPSDGIAQRVLCLGSADIEVYSKGIYNSNNTANDGGSQNPFGASLGSRGGSAFGSSDGAINLCKGFKATEPGYLMVITSLVPRVTYASGLDSKLMRYCLPNSQGEMANPILQNIGPEPIYACELTENVWERTDIFGYTDRYGHFKAKFDELHGLVRDGESLESFALQRYLDAAADAYIDNEFLQIPTDYMDNVTAVKSTLSEYGCWVDSYFKYRVSMPLAKYSLPSLQDPAYEHGKTIVVRRGGFRF